MSVVQIISLLFVLVVGFAFISFIKSIDASLHNAMVDRRKKKEFIPVWIDIMYSTEFDPDERIAIRHDLIDSKHGWKYAALQACRSAQSHPRLGLITPIKYRIEEEHGFLEWRNIPQWTTFI